MCLNYDGLFINKFDGGAEEVGVGSKKSGHQFK